MSEFKLEASMKRKLRDIAVVVLMIALGLMRVISGWFWITRPDPSGYLEDALMLAMQEGGTIAFYKPFLTSVVLPNKLLFATLVGWGELLTGLSFLSGTLVKLSAWVFIFMLANFALMNGAILQHLVLIGLQVLVLITRPSMVYGGDRWLSRKFPESRWL